MKIGIDIDGTVCDSMPVILEEAKRITGRKYTKEDIRTWNQPLGNTDIGSIIDRLYRHATIKLLSMNPMEGSVAGVRKLAEKHDVVFVTSRHILTAPATNLWIHHHFGDYRVWHTGRSDNKAKYGIDLLIDDAPEHAKKFSKTGYVVLFDQPWNRKVQVGDKIARARSWSEVVAVIGRLSAFLNWKRRMG